MKILDAAQLRELDNYTIEHEPVSSIDLMERASGSFARAFTAHYPPGRTVHIFAGPGNNGGDALAVARMLFTQCYDVKCYLVNPQGKLSPDCTTNKERLLALRDVPFVEIKEALPELAISKNDLIIDGLFGTGLDRPLTGIFAELVERLNASWAEIVSIDLPSGTIQAARTFTFQSPKLSFLLPDTGTNAGAWEVLDIGLSPEGMNQLDTHYYYTQEEDIIPLIPKRGKFSYKNQFGHALIVAGSRGKAGAAVLSAKACLRSGVGLVTAFVPSRVDPIVQTAVPEVMTIADPNDDHISGCLNLLPYSAIGIGPGLGMHLDTADALKEIIFEYNKPIVFDADALNIISNYEPIIDCIPTGSILTPHVGEFDRLAGESESSADRLRKAREMAARIKCIIVLKGAYTAVCAPDRRVYFNSTGNPGMATAGSGDVLTGIITALLAKGLSPLDATRAGVYLHGKAGDKAAAMRGEESLIAGDIIDML